MKNRKWHIFIEDSAGEKVALMTFSNYGVARTAFADLEMLKETATAWLVRENGTTLNVKSKKDVDKVDGLS